MLQQPDAAMRPVRIHFRDHFRYVPLYMITGIQKKGIYRYFPRPPVYTFFNCISQRRITNFQECMGNPFIPVVNPLPYSIHHADDFVVGFLPAASMGNDDKRFHGKWFTGTVKVNGSVLLVRRSNFFAPLPGTFDDDVLIKGCQVPVFQYLPATNPDV